MANRCPFASPGSTLLLLAAAILAAAPLLAQSQAPVSNGTPPAADLVATRVFHAVSFGEPHLRDLPGTRNIWGLIETADPFVTAEFIDNGGLYLGEPNRIGSYGSTWTQVTFTMDGLDLTDPERTGLPLAYPDPQGLSLVQVSSILPTLDATGPSTRVALVPRAPFATWGGSLEFSLLPGGLQPDTSTKNPPTVAEFGSARDVSVLLSGPFTPKVGVLASARFAASNRRERGTPAELESRLGSLFLHATSAVTARDRFRLVASVDDTAHPFAGRARFADRNVKSRDDYYRVHGVWERATAGGATMSAAAGFARGVATAPDGLPTETLGTMDRLFDGPVLEVVSPSGGTRQRLTATARFDAAPRTAGRAGRHALSAGFSLSRIGSTTEAMPPALIGELVDGLPARAWQLTPGGAEVVRNGTEFAVWASDRIALASRLSLEVGGRFESASASARDNPTTISWRSVEPRGVLTWDIAGGGGLLFHVGYTRHQLRLPLGYLAYGDTSEIAGRVYRWTDPNGDRRLQPGELGTLVATTGPGASPFHPSRLDPDLAPPNGDDFAFGLDARFASHWRFRLTGTQRHQWNLVAPVNEGLSLLDYEMTEIPDRGNDFFNPIDDRTLAIYNRLPSSFGKDATLLTNPLERHRGHQIGVAVSIERIFDGRWYMLLGGTASRSDALAGNRGFRINENDSGVLGELFLNPNARSYASGRQFTERGYQVKWSGGFVTGAGLHVGIVARYQDGQHFSRMVLADWLNQGVEPIQAYTRGHSRFTYTPSLDARIAQSVRVGRYPISIVLEGYNLLNMGIEVEEDPTVTRRFREFVVQQPPRALRLGFRVAF